ncbi:MAG: hypothetical protein EXS14_05195 [Planctomycetes bacterium]|nr:hypothetical protein [Planctomycetota bacterium]
MDSRLLRCSLHCVDQRGQQRWATGSTDATDLVQRALTAPAVAHAPQLEADVRSALVNTTLLQAADLWAVKTRLRAEALALGFQIVAGTLRTSLRTLSVRTREHEATSARLHHVGVLQVRPHHEQSTLLGDAFHAQDAAGLELAALAALQRIAARGAQSRHALPDAFALVLMPEAVESVVLPWLLAERVSLASGLTLVDDPVAARGLVHSIDRVGRSASRIKLEAGIALPHWIGNADEMPRRGLMAPTIEGGDRDLHQYTAAPAVLFAARAQAVAHDSQLMLRVDEGLLCQQRRRFRASGVLTLNTATIEGATLEGLHLPGGARLPALFLGEATLATPLHDQASAS